MGVELIEKCETVPGCGGGAYGGLYPSQVGVNLNMLPVGSDRNQGSDDQMTDKEIMEFLDRNKDMSRGDVPLSAEGGAEVEEYNFDQQSSSGEGGCVIG